MKFLFTTIVSILILVAVLVPGSAVPEVNVFGFDKLVHAGMFFTWSLAVQFDLRVKKISLLSVFIYGILFSAATEVMQVFVEGRTFDYFDILADASGLIAGILAGKKMLRLIFQVQNRE